MPKDLAPASAPPPARTTGIACHAGPTIYEWGKQHGKRSQEEGISHGHSKIVGTNGRIEFEYVGARYNEAVNPDVVLASATCLAEKRQACGFTGSRCQPGVLRRGLCRQTFQPRGFPRVACLFDRLNFLGARRTTS